MKSKYIYIIISILAIAAVSYPVVYSYVANPNLVNDPFFCAPLIPCQKPPAATSLCTSICYIIMQNSTFVPAALNVTVGATIVWVNHDGFTHTSDSLNSSGWASPVIPPGHKYSLTITSRMEVGYNYYYRCIIHNGMIGLLTVVSNSST
ncbi:MAG TPA: plastocyanin/azurin family copper-binding protein [Nitrososphaerales archaeon]|nr:plastocyanin/azurin family copper-binding protein [Nitrososphaerales archaeon]